MTNEYPSVFPKSAIGMAIQYSLQRWGKLSLYTTDGKLEIDNNLVENAIRPVAIGRKNYLFAGSHRAAQNAAMLYSFLGTCKINNINPYEWLEDVLMRIPNHRANKVEELLPHKWKAATSPQNAKFLIETIGINTWFAVCLRIAFYDFTAKNFFQKIRCYCNHIRLT